MLMLSPASAWAMNGQLDMVEYLSDYYPKLSCSQLEKKFQFVKGNPNAFFVSNAPYFWDIMERDVKRHSSKKMVPSSLLQLFDKYQGLCVGNASLRDFGVALDSAGQVNFTLQAVDDVGICPLPLDLVRYLVMARVLNHSVDLSRLIMAYAAALKAEIAYKDSRVNSLLSSSQKIQHVATGATPIPSKAPSIPSCASRRPSAIEQEVAGLLNRYEGTPVCIEDFHTKDALESTSTRTLYEAKYYLNRAPVGPSKNVQLRSVEKSAVSFGVCTGF